MIKLTERELRYVTGILNIDKARCEISKTIGKAFGEDSIDIKLVDDFYIFDVLNIGTSDVAVDLIVDFENGKISIEQAIVGIEYLMDNDDFGVLKEVYGIDLTEVK